MALLRTLWVIHGIVGGIALSLIGSSDEPGIRIIAALVLAIVTGFRVQVEEQQAGVSAAH